MKLNYLIYCWFLSINITMSQKQRDIEETLPTRQVHLDFHTSEQIPNIGAKFDKKQFRWLNEFECFAQIDWARKVGIED